ncbi:MAG: hypothetical protein ABSA93_03140 [Streptosporangiaceae bacterium]
MAIVVMFVLLFTGAVGIALLAGALGNGRSAQPQAAPEPAAEPAKAAASASASASAKAAAPSAATAAARALAVAGTPADAQARPRKRGKEDPFAPPSLVRSQTEQIPWMRTLLEFSHPALAIIGVGMWIGFAFIHQIILGFVAGGVLLVAAIAGVTWYLSGRRGNALAVNRRTLAVHATGAVLALVLALVVLTVARP